MKKITQQSLASPIQATWCPGCGNHAILIALKQALEQLAINEAELVMLYGIGCAGNMADFIKSYGIHSLHGRAVPNAIGVKLANHRLKVIVVGGDGDLYGEGLNHLIAAARGNHDITVLTHNNQMYSLTTGQSSPTTDKGTKSKSTPSGVIEESLNPLTTLISASATYVARAYANKTKHLVELIKAAVQHPGFALIDILQPCPTFNKVNTYQWFNQRVYELGNDYQASDRNLAWQKAQEKDKIPIGIIYQNQQSVPYHQQIGRIKEQTLIEQRANEVDINQLINEFK